MFLLNEELKKPRIFSITGFLPLPMSASEQWKLVSNCVPNSQKRRCDENDWKTDRPGHTRQNTKLQNKNGSNHQIYPPPYAILDEGIHGPLRSRRVFTAPAGWKKIQSWITLSSLHLPLILQGKPMGSMEYPTTCKHLRTVFKSAKHGVSANRKGNCWNIKVSDFK